MSNFAALLIAFAIPFSTTTFPFIWPITSKNIPTPPVPTIKRLPTTTPTQTPTSTPTVVVTATSTPKAARPPAVPTNSVRDYIMNALNSFRASKGLSAARTDSYTCGFADIRAKEISTAFNHDGFNNRISSKILPYPSYSVITENLASTANYKNVVSMWVNSPGHAANMQKDTPFVCVSQYGNYFAYEGWKP